MSAREKRLIMLKTAKAERAEALAANDAVAADAILKEVIRPLQRSIAGETLDALQAQAQALNALSDILETALRSLEGRIDRLFLDDLRSKAVQLRLTAEAETTEARPSVAVPTATPAPSPAERPSPTASATPGAPPADAAAYAAAYAAMTARPEWTGRIESEARLFLRNDAERRYRTVEAATGVPWWVVGILHKMEASQSFLRHLHNGDPLSAPTTHVPAGRPPDWHPGMSWEESAVDALVNVDHLDRVTDWSIGALLERAERWNGLGYRGKGLWSPFLWCGTTYYEKGKYVADGVFEESAVSNQMGIAPLVHQLAALGVLDVPGAGPLAVAPGSALRSPRLPAVDTTPFPHADAELAFPLRAGQTIGNGTGIGAGATDVARMAARRVQEWCTLHGFVTTIDGQFGDATERCVLRFQRDAGLPTTGSVDEECWARLTRPMRDALGSVVAEDRDSQPRLSDVVLDVAAAHIVEGPGEAGGNNAGPWVRLYMDGTDAGIGGGDSHPWCAGFACFLIRQACRDLDADMPFGRRTLVADLVADAKADGRFVDGTGLGSGATRAAGVPVGGLFVRRGGPNGWDHTGIVTATAGGSFSTVEGNTTGGAQGGGRDGGIAKRSDRSYGAYDFIRLT